MKQKYIIDENGRECIDGCGYNLWDCYSKSKYSKTGYISICKKCRNKRYKKIYKRHPRDATNFHKEVNIKLKKIFGYKKYMVIPIEGGYFRIRCYTQTGHFIKMKGGEFTKEKIEKFLTLQKELAK